MGVVFLYIVHKIIDFKDKTTYYFEITYDIINLTRIIKKKFKKIFGKRDRSGEWNKNIIRRKKTAI